MKVKHWCGTEELDMSVKDVVHDILAAGNGDVTGALEILELRLETLTKAFSVLVEHIGGEEAAAQIIKSMICPIYRLPHNYLKEREQPINEPKSVQPEPFFPRDE